MYAISKAIPILLNIVLLMWQCVITIRVTGEITDLIKGYKTFKIFTEGVGFHERRFTFIFNFQIMKLKSSRLQEHNEKFPNRPRLKSWLVAPLPYLELQGFYLV